MSTSKRLSKLFISAPEISFDASSKLVFISDCHRGDGTRADNFAHNRNLYHTALDYYYKNDYTYIELGDGDELWENWDFSSIKQMYLDIFLLLRKFYTQDRLYMLWGNHDIDKRSTEFLEQNLYYYEDPKTKETKPLLYGIKIPEGLKIHYGDFKHAIFLVHGHQGDLISDKLWRLARFKVHYLWRPLEILGLNDPTGPAKNYERKTANEKRIIKWVEENQQPIIAGHSHLPYFPSKNSPPYFNDGSCVHPYAITAIEISNHQISLVKWTIRVNNNKILYVKKETIGGPTSLNTFFF